jgi:glucosamine--fructose-6-phosphate aminotransferase (isomerizing)
LLLAISDCEPLLRAADLAMPLSAGIPEWLLLIAAVVPGQLLALGLSLARGGNPDAPPGLSKVTHTH